MEGATGEGKGGRGRVVARSTRGARREEVNLCGKQTPLNTHTRLSVLLQSDAPSENTELFSEASSTTN